MYVQSCGSQGFAFLSFIILILLFLRSCGERREGGRAVLDLLVPVRRSVEGTSVRAVGVWAAGQMLCVDCYRLFSFTFYFKTIFVKYADPRCPPRYCARPGPRQDCRLAVHGNEVWRLDGGTDGH